MVISNVFKYPESNVRYYQSNVRAVLDKKDLGLGRLFVSESILCWKGEGNTGFSVGYQDISLHAISKDETLYPTECLYIMLAHPLYMQGEEPAALENDDSDVESECEISELIFAPNERVTISISNIYEAIKICQELNPDPEDMEEDDDNLYADAEDEVEEGDYAIHDIGTGDADIDDISRRIQENSVDLNYSRNGNDEDEFQDAD